MAFDLGTVFATVGIDTSPIEAGVGVVASVVDDIIGHLERIGDVAIGVALGDQIGNVITQLERLPQTLVDVQSGLELFNVTLGTLFEQTSEQSKHLLDADQIEEQV